MSTQETHFYLARLALKPVFGATMRLVRPFRRFGIFGTPSDPIEFAKGEPVPWWLQLCWARNSLCIFTMDVETYWNHDGRQWVRPLWRDVDEPLIEFSQAITWAVIYGAPTCFYFTHRPRRNFGTDLEIRGLTRNTTRALAAHLRKRIRVSIEVTGDDRDE